MQEILINGHKQFVFSDEEKQTIKHLFVNEDYQMRALCRKFNCSQKPMKRVLDELKIDHSRGNLTSYVSNYPNGLYDVNEEEHVNKQISELSDSSKKKYYVNDHYFDDIRSPEVIYTIGFLYADGCNHNNEAVSLSLEEGDVKILQKISDNLQYEKGVVFIDMSNKHDFGYNYKNQYCLQIYNRRIANALNILGVTPRKSLTLEFPKWLHPTLYSHFLRGVFDGDGSISRYFKDGKARNTLLTITQTESFCRAIMDIAAKQIGINSHIYDASCHNGVTKVFQICGANICKKFLDWLYKDSTIFLQRKYDRYCSYYNIENPIIV